MAATSNSKLLTINRVAVIKELFNTGVILLDIDVVS